MQVQGLFSSWVNLSLVRLFNKVVLVQPTIDKYLFPQICGMQDKGICKIKVM